MVVFKFIIIIAHLHDQQDLGFLTKDWTSALCSRTPESSGLLEVHWTSTEVPIKCVWWWWTSWKQSVNQQKVMGNQETGAVSRGNGIWTRCWGGGVRRGLWSLKEGTAGNLAWRWGPQGHLIDQSIKHQELKSKEMPFNFDSDFQR